VTTTDPEIDHVTDPFVTWTVDQIIEGLNELCDGGDPGSQDAPFGSYARPTSIVRNVLIVRPNDQAEDWDDEMRDEAEPWLTDFELNADGFPERPVVRITVERIDHDPEAIEQTNAVLVDRKLRPIR
jgi:hypothetical protein